MHHLVGIVLRAHSTGNCQVVDQVPTVRHLRGMRRTPAHGTGVHAVTIAADHLNAGVLPEPANERIGRWIFQQVDRSPFVDIDKNGPVPATTPHGELVNAKRFWRADRRHGQCANEP